MTYSVKEAFFTLQGEGANTGRPAVFCRFSGCNLWTGREADRAKATCTFCDTDFVGTDGLGGGRFQTATLLAQHLTSLWPDAPGPRFVVFTGGEPLLQLDEALVDAMHEAGFEVAVETNGTVDPPDGIDWICVSPKAGAELRVTKGNELKLVYPQADALPERFEGLDFETFYLQPMDGLLRQKHTQEVLAYCMAHPRWRMSLQTHKILNIP